MNEQKITVEELWKKYRDACYGKDLSRIQEVETRQAFYAGCLQACVIFMESAAHLDEKDAMANIARFMHEIEAVTRERMHEMKQRQ